jgi:hypothetical protein
MRGNLKFTAPLTAITAAVVGVILNLAMFFAYHVFWPQGFTGTFEWPSALLGLTAGIAISLQGRRHSGRLGVRSGRFGVCAHRPMSALPFGAEAPQRNGFCTRLSVLL